MTLTINALFLLGCIGTGAWLVKKNHHKKREVVVASLFWILLVGTAWGTAGVNKMHHVIDKGVETGSETVNDVSK